MSESPISRERAGHLAAQVYALVRACPEGRVTTYGALGGAIGFPRGARMVGWIMNETPRGANVPAQRVVSAKGELTGSWAFGQRGRMRELLAAEGVTFTEAGAVDMKRHAWDPRRDLSETELNQILSGAAPVEPSDHLMRLLLDDPASPFRVSRSEQP